MSCIPIVLLLVALILPGQTIQSRTDKITRSKEEKVKALKPEVATKAENFLRKFKDEKQAQPFQISYKGLSPKFGNMVTGGGFAAGLQYLRDDLFNGEMTARASAQISTRAYQKFELQASLPKLVRDKVLIDLIASHRNFGGLNYYGNGPDSRRTGRSTYRLKENSFDAIVGFQPGRI